MRQDLSLRLEQFKKQYVADEAVRSRIAEPPVKFIGDEIMELAVAALLQGENVLLSGGKATGKNILADNLAWLFRRPVYTVSFHVNTDSSTLIGTDTFTGGEVRLRRGPVALAAQYGGFCILDEINMAKNDAVAVLHSALDYRRLIDVPGYECIPIHPAARFIATMNYGYAGTRELNEALVSRFTVIRMPTLEEHQPQRAGRSSHRGAALRAAARKRTGGVGREHQALHGAVPRSERQGRERRDLDELRRYARHDRGPAPDDRRHGAQGRHCREHHE